MWFYGIVEKTTQAGDKQIGVDYLKATAKLLNADFYDKYKEWYWCVKRGGKYINITEYLPVKDQWRMLISDTLDKIYSIDNE